MLKYQQKIELLSYQSSNIGETRTTQQALKYQRKCQFCCSVKVAAEQKARATYEKLIDLCRDNPDVLDPLRYLRQREVVHFQRFGEALRGVQDKLAEKKFYINNMNYNNR